MEHAISSDDIFWMKKPPGKTWVDYTQSLKLLSTYMQGYVKSWSESEKVIEIDSCGNCS